MRIPGTRVRVPVWAAALVAGATLIGLFAYVAVATDRPRFCRTCHEMGPYYAAWRAGRHAGGHAECVECHVGEGMAPRLAHKFLALQEVWIHFTGDPGSPMSGVSVPDARCAECHESLGDPSRTTSTFRHASHPGIACMTCHPDAGHAVSLASLRAAGVLSPAGARAVAVAGAVPASTATRSAESTAAGHVRVVCTRCHDIGTLRASRATNPLPGTSERSAPRATAPDRAGRSCTSPRPPARDATSRRRDISGRSARPATRRPCPSS